MSRTSESDDAFDDLLWELDVTSVRPRTASLERRATPRPQPQERVRSVRPWSLPHLPAASSRDSAPPHQLAPAPAPVAQPHDVESRPAGPRAVQPQPQSGPLAAGPRPAEPRAVQPRAPRAAGRTSMLRREPARFARPELHTLGERIAANRLVQAAGATVLLGGTSVLVVIALSRG